MRNYNELGVDFSQIKIAVVDDIPANTLVIEKFLQVYGFKIVKGNNGRQALDIVYNENPDLLLIDIMMPVMGGFDVIKQLRSEGNEIPIIIMSALNAEQDIQTGLTTGADDYVTKPIIRERLISSVMNNIAFTLLKKMKQQE